MFGSAAGVATSREVSGVEEKRLPREGGCRPLIGGGRELASGDGRPVLRAAATRLAWHRAAACAASGSCMRLIQWLGARTSKAKRAMDLANLFGGHREPPNKLAK